MKRYFNLKIFKVEVVEVAKMVEVVKTAEMKDIIRKETVEPSKLAWKRTQSRKRRPIKHSVL